MGRSPGSDDGRPERENNMTYKNYKKVLRKLTLKSELEKLLHFAENDFDNLTDRQYENLRFCIIKKIYA